MGIQDNWTDYMTGKQEIKQFNLILVGDTMSTSGNMTLNEVASALVTLAYGQGMQDKEPVESQESKTAPEN